MISKYLLLVYRLTFIFNGDFQRPETANFDDFLLIITFLLLWGHVFGVLPTKSLSIPLYVYN